MSVRFLNDRCFANAEGQLVLVNPQNGQYIPGACFVMFFSPNCPVCQQVSPDFDNLSRSIQGMTFGKLDINQAPNTHQISQFTSTPLVEVPTYILYLDGFPQQYRGQMDSRSMAMFLNNILRPQQQPARRPVSVMMPQQQPQRPQQQQMRPPVRPPPSGDMGEGEFRRQARPEPSSSGGGYIGPYPTYEEAYPGADYRNMARS